MNRRGKRLALGWGVCVSVLALMALFGALPSQKAYAAGNPELSFEGKIVTAAGVNVPDGTYAMEFTIYTGCSNEPTSSTGCSAVWTEDYAATGHLVSFTSGTFQVNLGSITPFASLVPWDTSPLYLSMQISNTAGATCTPAGNFTANCTGDGVMNPYIELTAAPYAEDSAELGGLTASAFGQLATNQSFTGTNTFQPATNITGAIVQQTSFASPTADVFDVQGVGGSADNFIQVTSTGANAGVVSINSLGSGNALNLDSGSTGAVNIGTNANSKTIQIGATNSAITDTVSVGNNTNAAGITNLTAGSLSSTSQTTIQSGANGAASLALTTAAGGGATITQNNEPTVAISGASEPAGFTVNSGDGGATSGVTGQTGGTGGAVLITSGNGGNASSGSTNGNGGNITLSAGSAGTGTGTAGSSGSVIIQNTANSSTAFEIQNAAGQNVFSQGTTLINQTNDIINYTFTGGTTGWAVEGSATALTQVINQTNVYPSNYGLDAIQDTLAASGTSGIEIAAAGLTGSSLAAGTYQFGFYAKGSATISGLTVAFNGTGGTCTVNATTISNAGFTYYTCTAITSTATTIVTIESTSSASQTLYISDPQIVIGTLNSYQLSSYQTNGVDTASQVAFENSSNSTTAFQVQNSAGTPLLDVDTTNDNVVIGSNTNTNNNFTLLQLNSYNTFGETETCSASNDQGAVYYNTVSNDVRACVNGNWEDMVSTSGLGILLFGVVPDSANAGAIGDLGGISGNTNSPCKVVIGANTSTLTVEPCTAYSGGRKVIVPSTSLAVTSGNLPAKDFANICLSGTNDQPTILTFNTAETTASLPAWSPNNPVLCLAEINAPNGGAGTVTTIWDTRTFTTSQKTFTTDDTASSLGMIMVTSGTANLVKPAAATPTYNIVGVNVAWSGTIQTATINMIIATGGPTWVKANTTLTTLNEYVEAGGGTTVGYASEATIPPGSTTVVAEGYGSLGLNQTVYNAGTCSTSANCQGSVFLNPMNINGY